ncbi:hypothetical protein [Marinicrinis sediminis]|uniref:DUF4199 domain-containing protein n=1 Tax=Marinicrinis sediminis TaxID=1652465 RepID=A0ABW5RB77_9BACL
MGNPHQITKYGLLATAVLSMIYGFYILNNSSKWAHTFSSKVYLENVSKGRPSVEVQTAVLQSYSVKYFLIGSLSFLLGLTLFTIWLIYFGKLKNNNV